MEKELNTVKLIDQAAALINDPQLGFAASIEKPVQEVDIEGERYMLTLKIHPFEQEIMVKMIEKVQRDFQLMEDYIWSPPVTIKDSDEEPTISEITPFFNYEALLKKYIAHISSCEGMNYIPSDVDCQGWHSDVVFTKEEIEILNRLK